MEVFLISPVLWPGPASDCGEGKSASFADRGSCSLVSVSGALSPGGGDAGVNERTIVSQAVEMETLGYSGGSLGRMPNA